MNRKHEPHERATLQHSCLSRTVNNNVRTRTSLQILHEVREWSNGANGIPYCKRKR